jgi:2'-5' RNA ligase
MTLLRTFIAIELPPTIQEAIARETSGLRQRVSRGLVRWVEVENMHLTLRFLGDTAPSSLSQIEQMLSYQVGQFQPMQIKVGGFGVFPSPKRPRVLWIGTQAPAELTTIQHRIESLVQSAGFEAETRPFSPHLTVGRVSQKISSNEMQALRSTLETIRIGELGSFTAEAIHLIRSDLRPEGAVYSRLFSARLGASQ